VPTSDKPLLRWVHAVEDGPLRLLGVSDKHPWAQPEGEPILIGAPRLIRTALDEDGRLPWNGAGDELPERVIDTEEATTGGVCRLRRELGVR
jgi:hypothetical protein